MSDYLDPENEELLKDFFIEAEMQVEVIERTILAIENNPKDHDAIDELFRAVHTLKGGAYTVQMNELALFTHKMEDLLDEVRDEKLKINPEIIDLLLNSIDVMKEMFEERMEGRIYAKDTSKLEEQLMAWISGKVAAGVSGSSDLTTANANDSKDLSPTKSVAMPSPLLRAEYDDLCQQAKDAVYRVRVHFDESNPMNTIGAVQVFVRLKDLGSVWLTHPDFEELYEDRFFEYADFYLESAVEMAQILTYVMLPDVTLGLEIDALEESMIEGAQGKDLAISASGPSAILAEQQAQEEEASLKATTGKEMEVLGAESIVVASSVSSEAIAAGVANDSSSSEPPHKVSNKRDSGGNSSVLRVDSRRVDEILNLVSEAVINKATFNQVNGHLLELANELHSTHLAVRNQLNQIIEELLNNPLSKESIRGSEGGQQGSAMRNTRKKLQEKITKIHSMFDPLENRLKNIMVQFGNSSASLARNTNGLHEAILSMRMVPIGQVFSRFPRLVRDLSRLLEKRVELVLEGEETGIDKSVAEELVDPLMHCVRNSMDHGIENKELRSSSGKPETGQVKLSAINQGNYVIIEISDDGGGIAVQKIREKAIANGVISDNKVLSDQEAFNLIFSPGFSTATEVTSVSGRGVGLDVVKKQIEKLNGSVNVWSELGHGTRFTIRLPLTLAIIQGLLVRVHSEVYAIPITAVAESIRITQQDIHLIDNYEVISVRDDVISLLRLNRIFQLEEDGMNHTDGYMFVVVVGTGDRRVGLMVDSLIGEEDVVIKPLVDRYTHSPGVAGATILGDGTVSLILDVIQLLDLGLQYERFMREQRKYL